MHRLCILTDKERKLVFFSVARPWIERYHNDRMSPHADRQWQQSRDVVESWGARVPCNKLYGYLRWMAYTHASILNYFSSFVCTHTNTALMARERTTEEHSIWIHSFCYRYYACTRSSEHKKQRKNNDERHIKYLNHV